MLAGILLTMIAVLMGLFSFAGTLTKNLGAPEATVADVESGMARSFESLRKHSQQFPEFTSYKQGARETWISEGSYQIGSLHDPQKVIFVRSVNPGAEGGVCGAGLCEEDSAREAEGVAG